MLKISSERLKMNVCYNLLCLLKIFLAKVEPGEGRSAEYNGGSEKDSSISGGKSYFILFPNISIGEGMNEDIKQLKDFKALISEKTVPKSIRLLSRTVIILLLLLIVLASKRFLIAIVKLLM